MVRGAGSCCQRVVTYLRSKYRTNVLVSPHARRRTPTRSAPRSAGWSAGRSALGAVRARRRAAGHGSAAAAESAFVTAARAHHGGGGGLASLRRARRGGGLLPLEAAGRAGARQFSRGAGSVQSHRLRVACRTVGAGSLGMDAEAGVAPLVVGPFGALWRFAATLGARVALRVRLRRSRGAGVGWKLRRFEVGGCSLRCERRSGDVSFVGGSEVRGSPSGRGPRHPRRGTAVPRTP